MRKSVLASLALAAWALSGCMLIDSISPQVRLGDQVHQLNDEIRWGRVDLAAQRVASSHRAAFVQRHRSWGHGVSIADADVTNMDLGLGEGRAASYVTYSWFDEQRMEVTSTTVRQIWRGEGEGFVLIDEQVIGGDERLLPGAPVIDLAAESLAADGTLSAGGSVEGALGAADEEPPGELGALAPDPPVTAAASPPRHRDAQGLLVD